MKPLCPKCLTTHWVEQACKVKSLAEIPAIFPSPPPEVQVLEYAQIKEFGHVLEPDEVVPFSTEVVTNPSVQYPATQIDDSFHNPEIPAFTAKPKKVLSKAHLAALKAGREAKAKQK